MWFGEDKLCATAEVCAVQKEPDVERIRIDDGAEFDG